MDEEIKKDGTGDERVFVDALSDDASEAKTAAADPAPATQAVNNQTAPADQLPPVNNQAPQVNPMPPVNSQMPPVNNQTAPVNQMPPVNSQLPPVNQSQPANNQMPPVNQAPPVNSQMPPVNQSQPVNNQMPPVNQVPPVNNLVPPAGSPVQQQPATNPLFSAPPQEPPKKKKKGGGIIAVLIIILILLAGGTVAILFATGVIGPKKEIQLSKTSVKLEKGEEIVIRVENYEDDLNGVYLIYESGDTKIAKITEEYDDAFIIEGKKKGKTTITVSGKRCETVTINVTVKD